MVDPVQAPFVEQGNEIKIEVKSQQSTYKICPKFLQDISPSEYQQRKKSNPMNGVVCVTNTT
jgi:hypothetical protein